MFGFELLKVVITGGVVKRGHLGLRGAPGTPKEPGSVPGGVEFLNPEVDHSFGCEYFGISLYSDVVLL